MSYEDELSAVRAYRAEHGVSLPEPSSASQTPTSESTGSSGDSTLAAVRAYRQAHGINTQAPVAPAAPVASDRGRGNPSHLRQSMAEGSPARISDAQAIYATTGYDKDGNALDVESWGAKLKEDAKAAEQKTAELTQKLDTLKANRATNNRLLMDSPMSYLLFRNRLGNDSSEEIEATQKALEEAQADMERIQRAQQYATQFSGVHATVEKTEEAREQGKSYSELYAESGAKVDNLKEMLADYEKRLKDARSGDYYERVQVPLAGGGHTWQYAVNTEKRDADISLYSKMVEDITRQLEREQAYRDYVSGFLTQDEDADYYIMAGKKMDKRLAAEQAKAGREVLETANLDSGIATYTRYRGATREGVHVRDDWTDDQKNQYYYRLGKFGQAQAEQYAAEVNTALNQAAREQGGGNWWNAGTKDAEAFGAQADGNKLQKAGAGALGLAASVAAIPFSAMSYIDKLSAVAASVPYTGRDFALPSDIANAMVRGRSEQLNKDYGTISEDMPVIGGKGFGDLYQLGQSVVQSIALGNAVGEVGTLAAFFVQAADNAFDEAKARGGSDEYAASFSVLAGAAEAAGEKIGLDHLFSGEKALAKGLGKYLIEQGLIEGGEEGATNILNLFGDRLAARMTGSETRMQQDVRSLIAQGMSVEDAEREVWKQFVSETAYDMLGGFVSGTASGAVQGPASIKSQASNKLWEMRKDSVLGKQNAEGQREGGKKNASNDELRSLFDRALKRGDIRGAEQILQVIEQRGATAEEQEYGPVDPTANERMRKRLERQLNGERVNPETENAEIVTESATNRQLAEEARVQAEFPTVSSITMELVRRLDGKDFVTMAKSMTTQELAEVARYARYIGEEAKANLLEHIRLDPTYRYEEQPPAHTDEEAPLPKAPQNAVGQQVAPAGQITQPNQQNAAQAVKPVDSATAENKLFNVAQNPNGVSTRSTESGTMSVPNTQEVTTNVGEQAVQQPEEAGAEAAGFRVGRRSAGAGTAEGQLGASENASEAVGRRESGNAQSLPRFVTQEDLNELSDVEESAPISDEQKAEYSKFDNLLNSGTQVVNKPKIGSRLHLAWSLAKKLGLKSLFARNFNGSVFKDGSMAYQNGGNAIIDADSTQMELATAVAHEAGHGHYFAKFGAFTNILNGAYTKRLNFFTGVFNDAFGMIKGLQAMRAAEKYIREDRGYQAKYDRSHARYLREVNAMITNPIAQNATNLVAEMEKARAVEEFMNQVLAWDELFIKDFSQATGLSYDDVASLRKALVASLESNDIFTAEEIAAIDEAIDALEEGGFTDDLSDEEEFSDFEAVDTDADAADFKGDLNRSIRRAASGDTSYMKNAELLAVLNYALDRAAPTSKGQPLSERLSDLYNEYGNSATSYVSEAGDYFGRHVGNLSEGKTDNLMRTVDTVLRELDRRDYSFDRVNSSATDYENKFGIVFENKKAEQFDRGNGRIGVSKRKNVQLDLSQEAKEETSREDADRESEFEIEADYDRRNTKRDLDALRNGTNFVKEAVPTKPEDHGWIKPVEVSEKEVRRAREAVEAKGKEAELKDRIKTLEAQKGYLTAVANAMREARSGLYANEDVEQRKSDLGYLADNIKEQMDQLNADMGYMSDELDDVLAEDPNSPRAVTLLNALDNAQNTANTLNVQLEALRDEYKHLGEDSASLRNVRTQIDSVVSEIAALSRQLDGVSKRAERADWGSNKRTMFQAEIAENPNGIKQVQTMPEPNVYGPYKNQELNKVFRQQVEAELDVDADAADFGEPARGMGTGYVGVQRSRNKDGSLEFRTMYDDAPPTRPATNKSRKPLAAPSTAYSSVSQAARSILNSKSSFFDFSKDRPKDIPSKVTNTMGQLYSHVREMMEGDHPVNALMQLSNMVHEFENDDDLKVFSSDSIKKAVDELNDIYYNQDITNEEKAQRMVENATKTLTLISKRVQLVDRGYNMLKTFTGPRKKRDGTTFWSKYKAMQLNPSTLFKAMDGFARDKNGSGYQIAKMIENGTALYTITQTQALQKFSEIDGLEGYKEFVDGNAKPFDIDGVQVTEQQAVEFIMQVRNLRNTNVTGKNGPTNRLNTIDGFSIMDKNGNSTFIERSNDADGTNVEWFLNLAEAMENSLSPAAKKYLETATEILDDLGQQASGMRTNLIGTGFEGSINGTYYPITYGNKNGKSNSQQSNPAGLFSGPSYQSRTRNIGGYVNIKNVSDTMDKYIHWASNTIGYGEVAELLQAMNSTGGRMQNLSTLADEMLGQGYSEYISKFIDDVNEVPDGQKNSNSALATLRRNMASGALLGNLGVAAKQAASLWSAAGVLSPQALLAAETWFGGHTGAGNVLLQSRKTGTSLDPTISEILHNDSFMAKLMKRSGAAEMMSKATAFVDYQTVKRLFAATVVDTKLSFPGMDQNSELFAQTVEAKFQDVVLQTQPIFVKNARAGYLRSNDELMKAFAMFRTQPTQNLNAIVTAVGEYNAMKETEYGKAAGKKLRNTIIGQTASAVTFATLSAIVGFARHSLKKYRDDDDEISWAEVAKRIGLDTVESLAGISVFGGDLAKAIITMATGGEEKEFYDINAGVLSMLADTVTSVTTFGTNLVKAIREDEPLAVFNAGRQAADNILQVAAGIPANTVYRLLNAATMYTADAMYALSDGKLGNRADYDDAMKMLDSYIKGNLTEEGARKQADKAFRKDQPENLLYNLGILSSLTKEGSKTDKGRNWLDEKLKEKDDGLTPNQRILNYLVKQAVSADQMDRAVESYVTADSYNALYEAVRGTGLSPKQAIKKLDEIDSNGNGEIAKSELKSYYKEHGDNKLIEALWGAKEYKTIITDDGEFENFAKLYDAVAATGIPMSSASAIVDACKNDNGTVTQELAYQYYLAHPDQEAQIKALWEAKGWKTSFSNYKSKKTA